MTLKIYNTLAKNKEEFVPLEKKTVRMYVCGITPYDKPHLGHARCYIVFDVIHRYLEYKGFTVNYIQNFTDIDDKIINRSRDSGVPIKELVDSNIQAFLDNMKALNIASADRYPRVTDHIQDIINCVKTLIDKEFAYEADGSVYFSVRKSDGYGKLSGRTLDELKNSARVEAEPGKKDPFDFALWKKFKEGEPFWESPWGKGRPGWHIECSAMSAKYLGATLDIHGGGQDLIFPHHENEIAQSEAFTGKPFVRYWVHNGFITINKEKMSKSLGNIMSIDEILKKYHPMAVRVFVLNQHYRSPIDFSWDLLDQSAASYGHLRQNLYDIHFYLESRKYDNPKDDKKLRSALEKETALFCGSLDNDFNTAKALANLQACIRLLNTGYKKLSFETLGAIFQKIIELFEVLGVRYDFGSGLIEAEIQKLIDTRQAARKNKDFKAADIIRLKLLDKGIVLEDTPEGVRWKKK